MRNAKHERLTRRHTLYGVYVKRRKHGKLVYVCIAIASGEANASLIVSALNSKR